MRFWYCLSLDLSADVPDVEGGLTLEDLRLLQRERVDSLFYNTPIGCEIIQVQRESA